MCARAGRFIELIRTLLQLYHCDGLGFALGYKFLNDRDGPQSIVDFQLTIAQQSDAEQRILCIAFDDLDEPLLVKPRNHATECLKHDLVTICETSQYCRRLRQSKLVDDRAWNNEFASESRIDPSDQFNGFGIVRWSYP